MVEETNDNIGDDEVDDVVSNASVKTSTTVSNQSSAIVVSNEVLQMYYSHLFPFSLLYAWLSYDCGSSGTNNIGTNKSKLRNINTAAISTNKYFTNREFSLTIEPTPGEEIYIRYQSYMSQDELQTSIVKRVPKKIDIGAIYNYSPKDKNSIQGNGTIQPIGRELIFDIDMDDYDTVRHCGCKGSAICTKCWTFMIMAVKIIHTSLQNDFNFQHISWFYSGRRGIHCWVCDESAIELTDEARTSIVKYLQVRLKIHIPQKYTI
jgi:DNA primase small subunit